MTMANPFAHRPVRHHDWSGPARLEQVVEVSVFLFLIVPSMALSVFAAQQEGGVGFVLAATAIIVRDLSLVSLILFFLWRNREPVARIGWTLEGWRRELALGVVLFVPFVFGAAILEKGLRAAGLTTPSTHLPGFLSATTPWEYLLASILVAVVAVAEETIFRGYLLLRLNAVTRSLVAAVILASAIFAMGHAYEGSAGLATVGVMGVVLALVYVWRQSLVAPIVMHFLQDFLSIVLLPVLAGKMH